MNYKLRDWLFSRQRYWGEPFPVVLDEQDRVHPLSVSELPVRLPELDDFKPTGNPEPPLNKAKEWVRYSDKARRETNTMPQWAGSCWYFLRYIDPRNDRLAWDAEKERYWMPVDLYVGGAEHAVLHLLYSRFWHKVLYDRGFVSTAGAIPEAGQPGDDPGRDRVHGLSRTPEGALARRPTQAGCARREPSTIGNSTG